MFPYEEQPMTTSLDDLMGWLGHETFENTDKWIAVGALIEKRDLNVAAGFWFVFISNTIVPFQCHIWEYPLGITDIVILF